MHTWPEVGLIALKDPLLVISPEPLNPGSLTIKPLYLIVDTCTNTNRCTIRRRLFVNFFNCAAIGRAQFMVSPWFIYLFLVSSATRLKLPLGHFESRSL